MEPERALKFLDNVDGMAYAVRTAIAGYWGQRAVVVAVVLGLGLAVVQLSEFVD